MDGSNVVAMEDPANPPGTYDLEGTSAANAASWIVGSPSISSAGGKVTMKFTKNKGDGASVKVNANGNNNIVWAYGDGTAVSTHTNRGNVVVNFASLSSPTQPQPVPRLQRSPCDVGDHRPGRCDFIATTIMVVFVLSPPRQRLALQQAPLSALMLLLASLFAAHLAPRAAAERPFPGPPAVFTSADSLSSSPAPVTGTPSFVTHVRRQLLFERYSCGRSPLKGYTSSKRLASGLVLHWKATSGRKIKVAVVASGAALGGWFAVGWSPKGRMDGSNVVTLENFNSTIGTYDLQGTSAANIAWWYIDSPTISVVGSQVTLEFTKNKGDGASVKVNANGNNNIVWAYGDGTAVSTHTNRGNAVVNFACHPPAVRLAANCGRSFGDKMVLELQCNFALIAIA
ncbi:unnamed protein product [Closterium sp. Yama58-4]|nr:unnamed protein product [Closterium sp. Yama58-4]